MRFLKSKQGQNFAWERKLQSPQSRIQRSPTTIALAQIGKLMKMVLCSMLLGCPNFKDSSSFEAQSHSIIFGPIFVHVLPNLEYCYIGDTLMPKEGSEK